MSRSADWVRSTWPTVTPGANTIGLDVDYRPPILAVTGTMFADGNPIITPVTLQIRSFDASGTPLSDVLRTVTPDADGAYSINETVATGAVRAGDLARVGVVVADHPFAEVAGLTAGLNPMVLDVGYAPPSVTVSGTLLDGASQPLGPTLIEVRSLTGAILADTAHVQVTPDASGAYTTGRILLPLGADRVVAYARIGINGSDYVSATLASVAAGSNALRLDATYDPPTLAVSGTFVDGAGNALGPQKYIQATFYDGTTSIGNDTKIVDPAAFTGAYATTFTMPTHTTRAVVVAFVGTWDVDKIAREVAITPGANTLTLSAVYDPPIAVIGGRLTSAGAPITSPVTMVAVSKDSDGTTLLTEYPTLSPNSNGEYAGVALTLPNAATSLTVTLRVGTSSADWVTHTFPVNRGANTLTADAAVNVTTLNVSGELNRNGNPITEPVTVYVRSYNAANSLLAVSTHYVTSDVDNRYTLPPIVVPTGTVTVRTQADVSPFDYDDIFNIYNGIGVGANNLTFDIVDVATTLTLGGQLMRGDQAFTDPFEMRITYTATPHSQYRAYTIDPDDAGYYDFTTLMPDDTTAATVTYVLPSGTDPSFDTGFGTELSGFIDGTDNPREHSITWTPRQLDITGQVLIDDGIVSLPPEDYVTLDIEFLDADGGTVSVQSETLWDLNAEDGTYHTDAQPPEEATQAVVTLRGRPRLRLVHPDDRSRRHRADRRGRRRDLPPGRIHRGWVHPSARGARRPGAHRGVRPRRRWRSTRIVERRGRRRRRCRRQLLDHPPTGPSARRTRRCVRQLSVGRRDRQARRLQRLRRLDRQRHRLPGVHRHPGSATDRQAPQRER